MLLAYIALLTISHVIRWQQPDPWPAPPSLKTISIPSNEDSDGPLIIRYLDTQPHASPEKPVILLIHGSPMASSSVFPELAHHLKESGRIIAPDLPGFGFSTRNIENYGFEPHARYLTQFLNQLGVQRAHLVAYSMGGGVAIHLAAEKPERVASLTLVSSIGVQELELLGDYHLNHALHGLQLTVLWIFQELTPHMGLWDHWALNTRYARNFYDSDQRPLRDLLLGIRQPMLIVHGRQDQWVPLAVAREHHRLVPQSTLKIIDGGHLVLFNKTKQSATVITQHLDAILNGERPDFYRAEQSRKQTAQAPFSTINIQSASGLLLICYMTLIALSTLISEDLACIGAGMMAARGIIGFVPAVAAAFIGIVVGDLLLYAAGRYMGRPAIRRAPVKWIIKADDVERATQWFNRKGPGIIFASRFLPGSRLPVYFSAGVLGGGVGSFLFYFITAAAIWTPALVGLAVLAGEGISTYFSAFNQYAIWAVLFTMLSLWFTIRLCVPLFSFKGRRLLLSKYKRWRHWEFWPIWLFYIPIVVYILYLGLRRWHFTLFTAANPAIPAGGIVGESKSQILTGLASSNAVARFILIKRKAPIEEQMQQALAFMSDQQIEFPVICKPDTGERGAGVQKAGTLEELRTYLQAAEKDTIVQEYIDGDEYGVFYYRYPGRKHGKIFAVTDKRLLHVTGNGYDTLEHLILKDSRAVCQAPLHLKVHHNQLDLIPKKGEKIQLVSVGTHCRGALFLDGNALITPELTRSFDEISKHFKGFYFGRYDVRTKDKKAFVQGTDFTVLELNGVTSEATNIYDPANSLLKAWRTLMQQWKIAYDIGALNHKKGIPTQSAVQFLKLVWFDDKHD